MWIGNSAAAVVRSRTIWFSPRAMVISRNVAGSRCWSLTCATAHLWFEANLPAASRAGNSCNQPPRRVKCHQWHAIRFGVVNIMVSLEAVLSPQGVLRIQDADATGGIASPREDLFATPKGET